MLFQAAIACLIVLSVGVFIAHTVDALRTWGGVATAPAPTQRSRQEKNPRAYRKRLIVEWLTL